MKIKFIQRLLKWETMSSDEKFSRLLNEKKRLPTGTKSHAGAVDIILIILGVPVRLIAQLLPSVC